MRRALSASAIALLLALVALFAWQLAHRNDNAFRDALRADPELVAEYQALKLQMAEEEERGGPAYSAVTKRPFVARVLTQAGIEIPAVSPR